MNYPGRNIFNEPDIFRKIEFLRRDCAQILDQSISEKLALDFIPARDVNIVHPKLHPPKPGFSTANGQARMLHDLASIELQAMELGLRTLIEFVDAPLAFKEELMQITLSEATHLEMCLIEIESLGHRWGDWPIHVGLWKATSNEDSLLDRILIVHRYLEGSGLDAGDTLFRRLELIDCPAVKMAVRQITQDEIGHVEFGSRWYRSICRSENLNPSDDYITRMNRLVQALPKRLEPLALELRRQAGFSESELSYLQELRLQKIPSPPSPKSS